MTAGRPAAASSRAMVRQATTAAAAEMPTSSAFLARQPLGHGVGGLGFDRRGRGRRDADCRWRARWPCPCASCLPGRERRIGLEADRLEGRVLFLQMAGGAHEGAAGAQAGDEMRDLPARSGARSRARWSGSAPASWRRSSTGRRSRTSPGRCRPARARGGWRRRSPGRGRSSPRRRHRPRRIRLRSGETLVGMARCTGNPSAAPSMAKAMPVFPLVASSRVFAGREQAARDGVADDGRSGAILHAAAGVGPLRLGQQGDAFEPADGLLQADQRRVPDALGKEEPRRVCVSGRGHGEIAADAPAMRDWECETPPLLPSSQIGFDHGPKIPNSELRADARRAARPFLRCRAVQRRRGRNDGVEGRSGGGGGSGPRQERCGERRRAAGGDAGSAGARARSRGCSIAAIRSSLRPPNTNCPQRPAQLHAIHAVH